MVSFRTPKAEDAAALAELARSSFCDAFGHLYAPDDLSAFLAETKSVEAIAAKIANPRTLFQIAEADGAMIGYCCLGLDYRFEFDLGERNGMELGQLYLRGTVTGGGIGKALLDWAVDEGRLRGYDIMVLSVWQENFAAQRFYKRHGFAYLADATFRVGKQIDQEFLFALDLNSASPR